MREGDILREEVQQYLAPEEIAYYTSLGINFDSDLLDPKVDLAFKAIFTSDTDKSRAALIHFLSCVTGRQVKSFTLKNTELAVTGLREKQSIFDIHVTFNDSDEADLEMQVKIKDNLPVRAEFNTSKLFSAQSIKGKSYEELKMVYTIIILGNTLFHDSEDFFDEYQYRNKKGRELTGRTRIIFIELSKLSNVLLKPVSEMSGLEKWAVFFGYANHKDQQGLIQEIKESEEGIRMGAETLETISKDRDQFIAYYHRLKYEADQESQLIYAERKGELKGELKGQLKVIDLMRKGYSADEIETMLVTYSLET
jgi:predicted transposase/invertase (TIGR01784 family)